MLPCVHTREIWPSSRRPSAAPGSEAGAALPVSFLGTRDQQNGPPWYRSNSSPPAHRQFQWMNSSRVFIPRRASARCRSPATGRTPPSPARPHAVRALEGFAARRRRARRRRAVQEAVRKKDTSRAGIYLDGGFGVGKTHLLASLWHAAPGPEGLRHVRRIHQPGGRAVLPQDGGGAEPLQAGLHRRIRARRSGRHGADVPADARTGRRRRQARRDLQHPAGLAGRRPLRRRRLRRARSRSWRTSSTSSGSTARTSATAACRPRRRR